MADPQSKWTGTTIGNSGTPWHLFESAPADSFVFRNRFDLRSNGRFNFDVDVHDLSPAGSSERVILTSLKPDISIKDCDTLILWGGPYMGFDACVNAARKWRQIALSVFARLALGCDFGDDDTDKLTPRSIEELHIRGLFDFTASDNVFHDRVGLYVLPAAALPAAFLMLQMTAVGYSGLDDLPNLISAATQRYNGVWSDNLRLAYSLVHAALGATEDPEARYVFTVTAIEALIPYREKHPELSKAIEALTSKLDDLNGFDADTMESVREVLENGKRNSVNMYGRELASRLTNQYGGRDPKIFWRDSYKVRSGLAHGNPRSEKTRETLTNEFLELLTFVLDILESWTENPGHESDQGEER